MRYWTNPVVPSPPKRNTISCATSPPNLGDLQQFYPNVAATAANERASVTSPTKSEVSMDIADISASSDPHSCDPEVTAAVEEYTKGRVT